MKQAALVAYIFLSSQVMAQKESDDYIRQGNDYYHSLEFEKARAAYEQAIQADPANHTAFFNLANALYKLGRKQEAEQQYATLVNEAKEKNMKAGAWYNKGVILTQEKNLTGSIEAYKNALRQNSSDQQARENLQKALLEQKKKASPPPEKKEESEKNKQQQQSRMSPKETEQKLRLLSQKEKEVQQRLQKQLSGTGASQTRDW